MDARRRAAPAIPRCSTRRTSGSSAELGWAPRFADLETIVETAWRWHQAHPRGYAGQPRRPPRCTLPAAAPLRPPPPGPSRGAVAGDGGVRRRVGGARVRSIKPIFDDVLPSGRASAPSPARSSSRNLAQGRRRLFLQLPDGRRRAARGPGDAQPSCSATCWTSRRRSSRGARTGQLLSRINNDVGQVQRAVSETIGDLLRESLALVGYAALLFYYDAKLALVVHDRRAAGRLPAGAPRASACGTTTRRSQEAAGAHVARRPPRRSPAIASSRRSAPRRARREQFARARPTPVTGRT